MSRATSTARRTVRLKYLATLNPPVPTRIEDELEISFLPMEAIGEDGSLDLSRRRPAGEVRSSYSYFANGDVAYAKVTPCFENGKGAVMRELASGHGFGTTELTVLRPNETTHPGFLNYVLISQPFRQGGAGAMTGAGGLKRVPDEFAANFVVAVPSMEEQTALVQRLDRETARIDALIEKKTRFIELLREKRQALITQAVTQGLDPSVPMKDSGVEWLGNVPGHWDIKPLMHLTAFGRDIMYGIVLPGPDVPEGVPIVKGGDVKGHRLKLELLNRTTSEIEAPYARARLRPNDIVYSIRGSIGDAEPVPAELEGANITQDVARISPAADVDASWLLQVMRSRPVFSQLELRSLGATIRGINIFDLKRARIPVPPRNEQIQIASFLSGATKRLAELEVANRRSIELLLERRSALITAAVTGHIDLREAA